MEKQCFRCSETKPISEFYAHRMMADGHLGKCRACTCADVRENRRKKLDYYRRYDIQRWQHSEARRASTFTKAREWAERYPERRKAQLAVGRAVRDGHLIRPKHCECCGLALRLQAHHDDYSKPLSVRWLCKPCHWKADRKVA